jgi:TetR/AcrR family transcriptional repressor of nem operon
MLLAFMRGLEALHKGGVKPGQIKAAAEEMVALVPTG